MLTNAGLGVFRTRIENVTALFSGTFYLALSTDTTAPAATDTVLASEQTTNGLSRLAVTFAHTAATNVWTASGTITYTGSTPVVVAKIALFDAATGGNMVTEDLLAATVTFAQNGDSCTFSVNIQA